MRTEPSHTGRYLLALLAAGIALTIVITGIYSRRAEGEQLNQRVADQLIPTVALISTQAVVGGPLTFPGRIQAWARAPIYARVSGYLKRWTVDIGSPVKAGQVLAEIETPDLDQQLLQAQAELARARGEAALAATTAQRWQSLLASDSVSRQEAEEKTADFAARQSAVTALEANVERAQVQQRYKRLVAPFDGIVTARNTDVGSLINVGMTGGSELFVVSDTRRLRVYVSVPQRQVASIRAGSQAQLTVPERPGQTYAATVQSLSQAIDTGSGTMLIQLSVENKTGELLPGGFATVRLDLPATSEELSLPPSALIIGRNGVQVAVVDAEDRVRLRNVTIARDLGNVVALASGLERDARIINSPPDGIADGDQVRIATASQEAKP